MTPTICVAPVRRHWIPITISRCWANPAPLANYVRSLLRSSTRSFSSRLFAFPFLPFSSVKAEGPKALKTLKQEAVSKLGSGVQLIEQGLGLLQIERVEAFSEPAVDRSEKITSFIPLALVSQRRARLVAAQSFSNSAPCFSAISCGAGALNLLGGGPKAP